MLKCYARTIMLQLALLHLFFAVLPTPFVTSYAYKSSKASRNKRYLVFPPPNDLVTTKIQLIIGLGLPMEVDVSTIVGYVMKFNYVLPSNASYFTDPYVDYTRSNDKVGTQTANLDSKEVPFSRLDFYKMLTNTINEFGLSKACVLKTICEYAEIPLNKESSIIAELLHSLLTPSESAERIPAYQEYIAAEMLGRSATPGQCETYFPECHSNILDYFTEMHMD